MDSSIHMFDVDHVESIRVAGAIAVVYFAYAVICYFIRRKQSH